MVYRIYVEKKEGLRGEAASLRNDVRTLLGIDRIKDVRVINRYDAENIDETLFEKCRWKVFAEPQLDSTASTIEELTGLFIDDSGYAFTDEERKNRAAFVFAAETLPGRYDQRADSAEQCIQIVSRGERPVVRSAKVYVLYGELMPADTEAVMNYVINPAEAREALLGMPETLGMKTEIPAEIKVLNGFCNMTESEIRGCVREMGLAMDEADLTRCVEYFRDTEHRDPTITELRVIDTCWSERCRHTTFNTVIDSVTFEDPLLEKAYKDYLSVRKELGRDRPITLTDIATIAVRHLKREGKLDKLDESEEINACSVMINVEVNGENEPWLLFFRNETNNHPTDIEPLGGAASCLGGCISGPLSGRAYAYSAMRVTGAADPLQPVSETLPGKLPQRTITTTAAKGHSGYGNQMGICMGMVDEIYHPGYAAKRMEMGAVMAAAPAVNVRRERPAPGDVVMLLGGSTGRDGIGGAAGSSKAQGARAVEPCGADVQKGNASEKRKIQRLFRDSVATRMIKRCKDLGAGGISVAIGGLADGIDINLDAVPKKYEGLDGTELAISESQERMACVIEAGNEKLFRLIAAGENLQCVKVATVTEEPRLVMRWNGKKIADISGEFINSNGADKHIDIEPAAPGNWQATCMYGRERSFTAGMHKVASDLNTCSKQGLAQRFDSTVGAGTVLMPFGGVNQITPIQAMVHKIPLERGETDDCSLMAWGCNPFISEASPYHGAYLAVIESVSKLIATGASFTDVYLTFQEYFGSPKRDGARWGKPLAALLGAFEAQMGLGIGAIGGRDSMSDTFDGIDVPPALISFAVTMGKTDRIVSPEFKEAGHRVVLLKPYVDEEGSAAGKGLPLADSLVKVWEKTYEMLESGQAVAAYTPGIGGIAEAVMKMSYGNGIGFSFEAMDLEDIFGYCYGGMLLEVTDDFEIAGRHMEIELIGHTTAEKAISFGAESVGLDELLALYQGRLESVFPSLAAGMTGPVSNVEYKARSWPTPLYKRAEPKVLIPVFPGTNCEYDSARAIREAGGAPEIIIIKNRTSDEIGRAAEAFAAALKEAQIVFIPGGFSGGDGPDGSARLINAFFRNDAVTEGVTELLEKNDGLMCGVCSGFRALIRLGLVPYGKITDIDESSPALTFNTIGSYQSKIVRVRVASNKSPWLRYSNVGDIYSVPVSHGEGRFIASDDVIKKLEGMGQIATQYVDMDGNATSDIRFNPSGSMMAIEGITSPDGRVLGRMGHTERVGNGLYRNVPGEYFMHMFENGIRYFK